jgi:hypothetical protein
MESSIEAELEALFREYEAACEESEWDDASDVITQVRLKQMQTRCLAAIERATGRTSVYFNQAQAVLNSKTHGYEHLAGLIGIAQSLLHNIRADYMKSHDELVHGEVFSDFLEMAQHLLQTGYKDAAAVIAGSTLEAHLKQLCKKAGITVDNQGRPRPADSLNSDLAGASVYSKLDQKNVTAWLGLRNSAAHGEYKAYEKGQVRLLIDGVRDFITRAPA